MSTSRFDLLHPDIYRKVPDKQDKVVQDNCRLLSENFQLEILSMLEIILEHRNGYQLQ